MDAYNSLLDHTQSLKIVDTHEHLPLESERPKDTDVLAEWLLHYFSCDLVSAGLTDNDLSTVRDSRQDITRRWKIVEPYWRAAESTGYGRALAFTARDIYGIESINGQTIERLDGLFKEARRRGGHYRFVLRDKSDIAVSISDLTPIPNQETDDSFVFAMKIDGFVCPAHYSQMRTAGSEVGIEVHTLDDWMAVTRRHIEKNVNGRTRVVCLKVDLAYHRSLRFDKVTYANAEHAFNELFNDCNLPERRPPIKVAKVLSDWMMHFVCRVADDNKLVCQIHTGIQEGYGNVIYDANPTLLTNLFLEYRNARFDVFHMGYPYVMELGTLAKNFRNVFINMCWGHIISPEAARRALVEWLDAVPANKISAFGGDYCFVDGVYGHQFLARRNVAASLAQKVTDGSISLSRAREVATWLFVDNPKRLFGLDRFLDDEAEEKGQVPSKPDAGDGQ
ncbi:MAG: amidohydrolase family protein [Deltaproteobacteria bacterium]|nr:amidohydrolase family protein [Deltaproteobacteria bacterium]